MDIVIDILRYAGMLVIAVVGLYGMATTGMRYTDKPRRKDIK